MNAIATVSGGYQPGLLLNETIPQLLNPTIQKFSDKTAFIFKEQQLTYKALDSWSNAVACTLIAQGILPGDRIGLWLPRGLELPVAVLGILKAGATYVPLDHEMPTERVETAFNDINVRAYFSRQLLNVFGQQLAIPPQPIAFHPPAPANLADPNRYAYILFTSGSTGKPKGIGITHQQICHFIRAEQTVLQIQPVDRVYQGFSISFDMWCEETWISLYAGATLWTADAATAQSIHLLSDVLRGAEINVLHAVPSLLAIMDHHIPSIHTVNAGGEACTSKVIDKWARPGVRFFNSYGPTETTVSCSIALLTPGNGINIGKPLPNYHLAVVDENLNALPTGEEGELIVAGPGVADGYVNRVELTKQKFLPKPSFWSHLPGKSVFRTGDAAIIQKDGTIEFRGRRDNQVKLHGYRIELGEIENQLANFPYITAAAAAIKKNSLGLEQLVAYVCIKDNVALDALQMRKELARHLPSYMIPTKIITLDIMPRLTNGKIDRSSLISLQQHSLKHTKKIENDSGVAAQLLSVLKTLFPGREITLEDDFFTDLGGHSLLAAAFVARLQDASMLKVSLKDIYQNRPLHAILTRCETAHEGR